MGIRMDQLMGLLPWAEEFVAGTPVLCYTEEVTRIYPDGRKETCEPRLVHRSLVKEEKSGECFTGMFDQEYSLSKYTFPDGRVYFERVEKEPWSSGPMFFLALQDAKGNWVPESLWCVYGECDAEATIQASESECLKLKALDFPCEPLGCFCAEHAKELGIMGAPFKKPVTG